MFNKYYQDELAYLREMGEEFAAAHPEVAHMLAAHGTDPDVERLLEGFSFLTGRIREKLDDDLPEITHSLMGLLWPHYLRPLPACSILEFQPRPQVLKGGQVIPRATEVASTLVDGVSCLFRTTSPVEVWPVQVVESRVEEPAGEGLRLTIRIAPLEGADLGQLEVERLRFFLHGEPRVVFGLYHLFTHLATGLRIEARVGGKAVAQRQSGREAINACGFADDDALLPYPPNAFPGYRLLQEYFALPAKFLSVELAGLDTVELGDAEEWVIQIPFRRPPGELPRVEADNLRLFCTPVVNLFPHRADPIRVEHDRVSYRIRPEGKDPSHYEIYSIDGVVGWEKGTSIERRYDPFYSFSRGMSEHGREVPFYDTRRVASVTGHGTETYVSFVSHSGEALLPPTETVALDLSCTNRRLPEGLGVGDIRTPTGTSPEYATFSNITRVTGSIPPPMEEGLHWRLISHLAVNHLPMASAASLRGILGLYNFQVMVDRQTAAANQRRLEGIRDVQARSGDMLFHGAPIRGSDITVELEEDNFAGEGDIVLFGAVLDEFFALLSTLNAYTRLTIRGAREGEVYRWPARLGRQTLL